MIIPIAIFFGAVGYLCYKPKDEVSLIEAKKLDTQFKNTEEDDLYKDLEDLFI